MDACAKAVFFKFCSTDTKKKVNKTQQPLCPERKKALVDNWQNFSNFLYKNYDHKLPLESS